ncbi:head-tail adaptor protein [Ochrobactrum sp. MYb29]|nr:head-tail adaptor protein [Ochrobactrum sp. MYb29]
MRAGKLDRQITIERKTKTKTPTGGVVESWQELARMRAEIVQQTATEFFTGYGEAANGTIIFRTRYLGGITTADRVSYDGAAYNLKEIKELGRRRGLELRGVAVS